MRTHESVTTVFVRFIEKEKENIKMSDLGLNSMMLTIAFLGLETFF